MNGPVICGIEDTHDDSVAGVARELAERYDLPLLFVHVLDGGKQAEEAARILRETTAPGYGELAIESGHPADRLVELTRAKGASFLVVGNHGPRSSLLGSISADVSRRATCPVVVVPPTEPDVRGGIARFGLGHAIRRVA
jgi:nucleotide-binding universal stress UspA family protein